MASGDYAPVRIPREPLAYNGSERTFNWEIESEHMLTEYCGNVYDFGYWRMELRFMLVDIERQLRASGGIKEWSSCIVPDLEGPKIKSLNGGWARTFIFSEYTEHSRVIRLTGDWLVEAEVWSYNYRELFDFDVRRNANERTVHRLSGRESLMSSVNQPQWREFYRLEDRLEPQVEDPSNYYCTNYTPRTSEPNGRPVYHFTPSRAEMLHSLMDNDARSLFLACPYSEESDDEYAWGSEHFYRNPGGDLNKSLERLNLG